MALTERAMRLFLQKERSCSKRERYDVDFGLRRSDYALQKERYDVDFSVLRREGASVYCVYRRSDSTLQRERDDVDFGV